MNATKGSVLSSIRPEYVPLESFVAEPIAWCPPTVSEEDTTLYVVVKSGSEAPKIVKLVNGKATVVKAKHLPYTSAIAPKPKTLLSYIKPSKVITAVAYAVGVLMLVFGIAVNTNVMSARVVLTNSMSGTFEPGDVVVSANWLEPKVNDVAMYKARDLEGNLVTEFSHRIISGSTTSGFTFKGDNNPLADVQVVQANDIIGVVLFWIPSLGSFLNPKTLLAVLGLGVFIYFAYGYIRDEMLERKLLKRRAVK